MAGFRRPRMFGRQYRINWDETEQQYTVHLGTVRLGSHKSLDRATAIANWHAQRVALDAARVKRSHAIVAVGSVPVLTAP